MLETTKKEWAEATLAQKFKMIGVIITIIGLFATWHIGEMNRKEKSLDDLEYRRQDLLISSMKYINDHVSKDIDEKQKFMDKVSASIIESRQAVENIFSLCKSLKDNELDAESRIKVLQKKRRDRLWDIIEDSSAVQIVFDEKFKKLIEKYIKNDYKNKNLCLDTSPPASKWEEIYDEIMIHATGVINSLKESIATSNLKKRAEKIITN